MDTVGAGIGEKVIFVTGSVAARVMADHLAPVDAAIVGIVDSVEGRDLQWDDGAGGGS
ncbi:MAG: EutN/CcmL family microcompartment protein [Kyrpidia sp.]|nr:EutN/CcmL family microcompartment protein [Kyrpidia sp.]